jgi:hypothetical protein
MNDLIVYEDNLWGKLKRKFSKFFRIFKRKEKAVAIKENNQNEINSLKQTTNENLSSKLQKEIKTVENKQVLIENVNDNMDVVQNFSRERLKQVSQLFDEACEIKMKKINELKNKIQLMQNSES